MSYYRIFIVGPIAAGKSTIRDFLVSYLDKIGKKVICFDINDVLKELHPPVKIEKENYEYDCQGALILKKPSKQIPLAIKYLAEKIQRIDNELSFIAEFGVIDFDTSFRMFKPEILREAYVIHVTAQFTIRAERNAKRGYSKVPDYRLNFYPESLQSSLKSKLKEYEIMIFELNNTGDLKNIWKSLDNIAKIIFKKN